ncbi:valine--tRNA ligase [Helicobacter sp. 16-1353]|nr:valine--tRNA ligase [Helicobacter sp. 16-1353]
MNDKDLQNAPQGKTPQSHNNYNPSEFEPRYYAIWEERGYFKLDSNKAIQNGKNFCIMMPPPNITGALHMGHALTYTLQDIITRYKRMDGFRVLWQPGIDHAGIATQNIVEKQLLAKGIKKEDIGREAFLDAVWKWKEESGGMILSQLRRLGASPNWERLRFTMDKGLQNAVKKAFVEWYNRGLIFQDNYMVNWCTHDGALSDIEVEYEENAGKLYYIRYFLADSIDSTSRTNEVRPCDEGRCPFETPEASETSLREGEAKSFAVSGGSLVDSPRDSKNLDSADSAQFTQDSANLDSTDSPRDSTNPKDYIIVATTRPETYFGDTAVMVNPEDSRFKHLVGRKVRLPLVNKEISIIADSYVDMEFGTGCVKVTPAHDINDYEVGKRHNLDFITIFDKNGILNDYCGEFAGLERLEARDKIVEALQNAGYIEKIEDYNNKIGKCYRCGNVVEPYISTQWFVDKKIAQEAIEKVNNGEAKFFPTQWLNNYNAWMRELRHWCISRQLWWGHRIPVFYCDKCGVKVASESAEVVCKCGAKMRQDSDVLDTWFSSGLWAFSTLGWGNVPENLSQNVGENPAGNLLGNPRETLSENSAQNPAQNPHEIKAQSAEIEAIKSLYNPNDLNDFYPNSLLITSFDILFFWVARMLFSGESMLGKLPFRDIYLHALVCDENGNKMSKSRGNVINPLELIESHSSDVLRFTLAYHCIQGRDIRISQKSLNIGNALFLKVLNALNFLLMYKEQQKGEFVPLEGIKSPLGIYMKTCFEKSVRDMRNALDSYRFNDAAGVIYKFLFNDFCDWGIELIKAEKHAVFELGSIFRESMKLLHPFMPFVSEFAYQAINGTILEDSSSIMIEKFPQCRENAESGKIAESAESAKVPESSQAPYVAEFEIVKDIVTSIRRAKIAIDFANKTIPLSYIKLNKTADLALLRAFIPKLAKCEKIEFVEEKPKNSIFDICDSAEIYIPTEAIDLDSLLQKLAKKKEKILGEKAKLESMLKNEKFLANAPKSLILDNQNALAGVNERLEKIEGEIKALEI